MSLGRNTVDPIDQESSKKSSKNRVETIARYLNSILLLYKSKENYDISFKIIKEIKNHEEKEEFKENLYNILITIINTEKNKEKNEDWIKIIDLISFNNDIYKTLDEDNATKLLSWLKSIDKDSIKNVKAKYNSIIRKLFNSVSHTKNSLEFLMKIYQEIEQNTNECYSKIAGNKYKNNLAEVILTKFNSAINCNQDPKININELIKKIPKQTSGKFVTVFARIYTALRESQTSIFKTNFLDTLEKKENYNQKLKCILERHKTHTKTKHSSRTRKAYNLTIKYIESFPTKNSETNWEFNKELFKEIHQYGFSHSMLGAHSNLSMDKGKYYNPFRLFQANYTSAANEKALNNLFFSQSFDKQRWLSQNENENSRSGKIISALTR